MNIIFYENQILIHVINDQINLPSTSQLEPIAHLLKIIKQDENKLIAELDQEILDKSELKLINLRHALNSLDSDTLKLIIYNYQLYKYYISHKYCGTCGNATQLQTVNKFVFCTKCNIEKYPHIAPCIIVRIHKGEEILMARGVNFSAGTWGLIAGFVEVGETLEEAVVREVKEEIGLEICNINYWSSQPWPFPDNSIMVGFTADYKSGEIIIDPIEIDDARFFTRDTILGMPSSNFSIAHNMINEFLNN